MNGIPAAPNPLTDVRVQSMGSPVRTSMATVPLPGRSILVVSTVADDLSTAAAPTAAVAKAVYARTSASPAAADGVPISTPAPNDGATAAAAAASIGPAGQSMPVPLDRW